MEILIVLLCTVFLLLVTFQGPMWIWIGMLLIAAVIGYRAYRIRCRACGQKVITGAGMNFCNQCGAEQLPKRRLQLRCRACRKMARSELNLNFCNHCGVAVVESS